MLELENKFSFDIFNPYARLLKTNFRMDEENSRTARMKEKFSSSKKSWAS